MVVLAGHLADRPSRGAELRTLVAASGVRSATCTPARACSTSPTRGSSVCTPGSRPRTSPRSWLPPRHPLFEGPRWSGNGAGVAPDRRSRSRTDRERTAGRVPAGRCEIGGSWVHLDAQDPVAQPSRRADGRRGRPGRRGGRAVRVSGQPCDARRGGDAGGTLPGPDAHPEMAQLSYGMGAELHGSTTVFIGVDEPWDPQRVPAGGAPRSGARVRSAAAGGSLSRRSRRPPAARIRSGPAAASASARDSSTASSPRQRSIPTDSRSQQWRSHCRRTSGSRRGTARPASTVFLPLSPAACRGDRVSMAVAAPAQEAPSTPSSSWTGRRRS